jgi:hypothetical protein
MALGLHEFLAHRLHRFKTALNTDVARPRERTSRSSLQSRANWAFQKNPKFEEAGISGRRSATGRRPG